MKPVDIALRIQVTSGPPSFETLPAEPLGGNRFRLVSTPGMALGAAAGDVVELEDGRAGDFRVVERSGNVGIQFFTLDVPETLKSACERDVETAIEAIGGWVDGRSSGVVVLTCHVDAGFQRIEDAVQGVERAYLGATWMFVNVYDPEDGATPLDWW